MVIREISENECRQALERLRFGRLGCARDNQPYVVPIYFAYDGQHLYGFSTPGQKVEWMRSNPRICLEADERISDDEWLSVVVFGRYEELPDSPDFAADRAHAQQTLREHGSWWEYASIPAAEWRRKPGPFTPIFYRLSIEQLTGHQATRAKPS